LIPAPLGKTSMEYKFSGQGCLPLFILKAERGFQLYRAECHGNELPSDPLSGTPVGRQTAFA
jgi:hypothetical protein